MTFEIALNAKTKILQVRALENIRPRSSHQTMHPMPPAIFNTVITCMQLLKVHKNQTLI